MWFVWKVSAARCSLKCHWPRASYVCVQWALPVWQVGPPCVGSGPSLPLTK